MFIYEYGELVVRTLELCDSSLLARWLSNTDILRYYEGRDNPHDEQLILDKFFDDEEGEVRCIIEYISVPIGYIQFYPISVEERHEYGYSDCNDVIYGTDQFIGESEYWGQGIGTRLVKSMINYLLTNKNVDKIVMDPQCWNHRAIACYEKCGFARKKLLPKHEMHEGEMRDCWLMEYSK